MKKGFGKPKPFLCPDHSDGSPVKRMKPSPAEKRTNFGHLFMSLSRDEPTRLVCAALVLALFAVLFRIASIWPGAF